MRLTRILPLLLSLLNPKDFNTALQPFLATQ